MERAVEIYELAGDGNSRSVARLPDPLFGHDEPDERPPDGMLGDPSFPRIKTEIVFDAQSELLGVAYGDGEIAIWNVGRKALVRVIHAGAHAFADSIAFHPTRPVLAAGYRDGMVAIWSLEPNGGEFVVGKHVAGIGSLSFDPKGTTLASASMDGTIRLWDGATYKERASLVAAGIQDSVVATPDFHYMAPKSRLNAIAFRVGSEIFPFAEFDLRSNRPDVVLSALGSTNQELIDAYAAAWKTRLAALTFDPRDLGDEVHLPSVHFTIPGVGRTTRRSAVTLDVVALDTKRPLANMHIEVNGVPVHEARGINLRASAKTSIHRRTSVALVPGENIVEVSVLNDRGARSHPKWLRVRYEPSEEDVPTLYVAAIGVSKYPKGLELRNAEEDAVAVGEAFRTLAGRSVRVETRVLPSNRADRAAIMSLKDWFSQSKPRDEVVLFLSGHGFLGDHLQYYFGARDTDPARPAEHGLAFDDLSTIVDGVPARRRLILLDTCNSGENDTKHVGTELPDQLGVENSFELMKYMFADLRTSTGAMVIAAAGGLQSAKQMEDKGHGAFTLALLEALNERKADLDGDGRIRVSELRDYVAARVAQLTNGGQQPLMRQENLEWDFAVSGAF